MTVSNINRVVLMGHLTRDPELRTYDKGEKKGPTVCHLRVACNGRRRNESGGWEGKPNFFDVSVFGTQGENVSKYLSKGRPVAIDGRLEWHEWTDREGHPRQSVGIVADNVQFLGGGTGSAARAAAAPASAEGSAEAEPDETEAERGEAQLAAVGATPNADATVPSGDADIPF